jgi:glucose-6-phosphate-specific signal transduction histidine kinase
MCTSVRLARPRHRPGSKLSRSLGVRLLLRLNGNGQLAICDGDGADAPRARSLAVTLRPTLARLHLCIADDGAGFDPAAARPQGHYGLDGMRERAGLIGGTLALTSAPGRGTKVELALPLAGGAT